MTKLLAIAGRKSSGKTTATNFLFGLEMLSLDQPRIIDRFKINEMGKLVVPAQYGEVIEDGIFDPITPNPATIEFLEDNIWPYIKQYNFADTLKQNICIGVLGLTWDQCYGSDDDKNSITQFRWENMPGVIVSDNLTAQQKKILQGRSDITLHEAGFMSAREIMQYVGTGIFRRMWSDVWITNCINHISAEESEMAIIGDCRFPNEVEAIQAAGGRVIYFTRNPYNDDHESETALDGYQGFDAVIDNSRLSIAQQNEELYKLLLGWEWFNHQLVKDNEVYVAP